MLKRVRTLVFLVLAALGCVPMGLAQSNQAFPQKQFYASDFSTWQIPSQTANTYTFFPISICTVPTPSIGSFYPFNTNAPVLIADKTASLSEVVTPSVVTPSAASPSSSQCGITVSPVNTHTQFTLGSATGGLQEALNQIGSTVLYNTVIWLDRNWYTAVNSVATVNPAYSAAGVIATVSGNANSVLIDNTTTPFTFYRWNGSKYVASGNPAANPFNAAVSSYTAISAPTALSTAAATYGIITTAGTGGTLPTSSTYRLGITYVDASGQETSLSVDSASTATIETGSTAATNTISITSPAAATGAVGYRVYMTAATGASLSEILYSPICTPTTLQTVLPTGTVCAIGSPATITAVITGTATIPVVSDAFPRTVGTSGAYPPFPALGTVATTVVGNLGTINIPAGYLNSLGKSLTFCGNGYATTNGTTGTLTFGVSLASLVGTTSISPYTSGVSGTTTASTQTPLNFCVTMTTAATGATGTLEVHGWTSFTLAPATNQVAAFQTDKIFAVSSTVDLTKQDQIQFTITPTTTGLTAAQLRQLTISQQN